MRWNQHNYLQNVIYNATALNVHARVYIMQLYELTKKKQTYLTVNDYYRWLLSFRFGSEANFKANNCRIQNARQAGAIVGIINLKATYWGVFVV